MNKAAARYYLIVLYQSSFISACYNTITRKTVQQQHKEEENARSEPELPSA